MRSFKISLDQRGYNSKPKDYEVGEISIRVGNNPVSVNPNNIRKVVDAIATKGQTFSPATFFEGLRRNNNFKQMQLLALDFDGGISLQEVVDRSKKCGLPILFSYETPTSKEQSKFRTVYLNDESITDIRLAEITQNALLTIFPEADKQCSDVSRMYFGGKQLLYFDQSLPTINPESTLRNMVYYLENRRGSTHYKRHVKEFAEKHKIRLNKKGLFDIEEIESPAESMGTSNNGKNSPSSIIFSTTIGEVLPNSSDRSNTYYQINLDDGCTSRSVGKTPLRNHGEYRSSTLKEISSCCRLFREFESGERRLHHHELFGLSTNIVHVETGIEVFKEILSRNSDHYDCDKQDRWDFYLKYNMDQGYNKQNCNLFCSYRDTCGHGSNIMSTVKPKMERLANCKEVFHPIREVEKDVERAIFRAYRACGKMWHIIKAQTSSGKTTSYLKLMMENPYERFLIAVPLNILKDQVYKDAVKLGIHVAKTPSLEEIKSEMPHKVRKHIDWLYKTGKHCLVHPYINETLKKKDIPCLREYMEEREKLKNFDGSVITTHRYFLNMDEKRLNEYDAIIIDEDIIFKSIISNQGTITTSDFEKLLKSATDIRLAKKIKKLLALIEAGASTIELPGFELDDEEDIDGTSTPIDVPSFCMATRFIYRKVSEEKNLKEDTVAFIKPVTFKNVKYIMVSATVDEKICRDYFGENNVDFYECKRARYEGELIQYYDKPMSRTYIDQNPGIIRKIMKRFGIGEDRVITFMKYLIGVLHYGNTEGCNKLEGKDLLVIGTPHHAGFIYKLFAFTIGLDYDEDAEMKRNRIVTYNGYRFPFTTYDDEKLRAIHFWMLESELEQAVGRARLLRHNCTVNLFSNFPLSQAVLKEFEYEREGIKE